MSTLDAFRTAGIAVALGPADPAYRDAVAGFDLSVEIAPDVVVAARTVDDVAGAVRLASEHDVPLTVLGSGHGRRHDVRGGVAIAMREFDSVEIDARQRSARIGAGCSWSPVVAAAADLGLAAPCGSAPGVGVVGYLLGGGIGPLASALGFSSDHVVSLDVVTPADGAITVSAASHPDLFSAMRGGKTGFGVVTAVTVGLLPLPEFVGGGLYFAAEDSRAVLEEYAVWASALPDTSTTSLALLRLPPAPALPEVIRGRHVVHLRFGSTDPLETTRAQLAPMRAVAAPLLDTVASLPFAHIGTIHGDPTAPMPVANGTASLRVLEADTLDALLAVAGLDVDAPLSSVEIRTLGGAARRAPAEPDAVGGRSAAHVLNVYAAPDPARTDEERLEAVRTVLEATAPWHAPTTLINFVGRANDAGAVAGSWSAEQLASLDAVRRTHDPRGILGAG